MKGRLSQAEILEAVNLYLRRRGDVGKDSYAHLRWRFGIVGDPIMTMVGEQGPDAGKVYIDWDVEELTNVVPMHPGGIGLKQT